MDEIKNTIIRSIETASKNKIADAYYFLVNCCDCPYWHECENEHECSKYILDKLKGR